jgi:hypothetical protein
MRLRPKIDLALLAALTAIPVCAGAGTAGAAQGVHATRASRVDLPAPAQFDLTLAEVSFRARGRAAKRAAGAARHRPSIRLGTRGPIGLDYVAGAITGFNVSGRPRALVLVVNRRPRGSLAPDLARIEVTVGAPRRLGRPLLRVLADPFTRPSGLTPALCDLPIRGAALAPGELRSLLARGSALPGFSAQAALAQAYNLVCRRPYDPAFAQAVTQGSVAACEVGHAGAPCCPPNAICSPPPCPPCPPCGPGPCPAGLERGRAAAIPCPLQSPPIACPL